MQKEINLKLLVDVIKRYLIVIYIVTAITLVLSGLYSIISDDPPPSYQSTTSILLNTDQNDSVDSLEVILRDPAVLDKVIAELELNTSLETLSNQITFVSIEGSKILKIMVENNDPQLAANIANVTANYFLKQIGSILGIYDTKVLSDAKVSNTPTSNNSGSTIKYLAIGFGVGLVLSILIVLFMDSLDDTVQSESEIEKILELPAIGSISKMNSRNIRNKPGQRNTIKLRGGKIGT